MIFEAAPGGPHMPSMPQFPSLATPLLAGQEPGSSRNLSLVKGKLAAY